MAHLTSSELHLTDSSRRFWRFVLPALFVLGLTAALFFYGVGYNHLFLLVSSFAALLSLTLLGPDRAHQAFAEHPVSVALAMLTLLAIQIQQSFFAISAETSFSPSWVLAAVPLWFLVVLLYDRHASDGHTSDRIAPIYLVVLTIVALLTLISAVQYFLFEERPHEPLSDVSNYGSLIYLVLIPTVHWWLSGEIGTHSRSIVSRAFVVLLLLFVVLACVVLTATASRACIGLVVLALLSWLVLGALKKLLMRRALAVVACAALGYLLASGGSGAVQTPKLQDLQADASLEQRALLYKAGLEHAALYAPWGSGTYTFGLVYPTLRNTAEQTSGGRFVHNDYIQLAAEGGIWFLTPLLLFATVVAWRCANLFVRLNRQKENAEQTKLTDGRAGGWLALAMLLAHASVNFAFYTLAVGMMTGVVAAWAVNGRSNRKTHSGLAVKPTGRSRILWLSVLVVAWANFAYLLLDNTDLAVFSGQQGLPGVNVLRTDIESQQKYANLSQSLNGDRSLAPLVLAMHRKREASGQHDPVLFAESRDYFRQALAVNPWNANAYMELADLLVEQGHHWQARAQVEKEADALIDRALSFAPLDLTLLESKAQRIATLQGERAALDWMMDHIFPWLEHFGIRSKDRALSVIEHLGRSALSLDDQESFQRIRQARATIVAQNDDQEPPVWLMRWRQERSVKGDG